MKRKGIFVIILLLAATQLALAAGAGDYAINLLDEIITGGEIISASLEHEHGKSAEETIPPIAETETPAFISIPIVQEKPIATTPPTIINEVFSLPVEGFNNIEINNKTEFEINPQALMDEGLNLTLEKNQPQILIIHTHATESFTQGLGENYLESDYMRTTDIHYNVIGLGNILEEILTANGISVIHDENLYDYPSYSGSYTRTAEAIEKHLAENPTIKIVFDIHRDAIGEGDAIFRTFAEIDNTASAQAMLLVGTGANGLEHPNWEENLKLALLIQKTVMDKYETLMRPLAIVEERYNQQLTNGSLIIEIGSTGNTYAEAKVATELFADAISPMLLSLMGNSEE